MRGNGLRPACRIGDGRWAESAATKRRYAARAAPAVAGEAMEQSKVRDPPRGQSAARAERSAGAVSVSPGGGGGGGTPHH